jgi:NAD(P)-dependent dehydrogenase (short-subunit alcohol dehydrogenase family)
MAGKVCVVTGGTSGIGGAISCGLVSLGARVVMVGRNADKGRAATAELARQTGNTTVEFAQADLLQQASIRELATHLERTIPRLDVLVNNVGGAFWKREVTADGVERSFALNLLAPFYLTNLLLPLLRRSVPARIVNVATKPRKSDTVELDDLQSARAYNGFSAYGRAKTGLIMYTYELARRLEGSGVTVNSMHPGVATDTDFSRDMPKVLQIVGPIFATLMGMKVTLGEAADTAVYLASSPEIGDLTGKYFMQRKPASSHPQTYDRPTAARLWDACAALVRSTHH